VAVVGGAARATRKALGATDRAIAGAHGGAPSTLHVSELTVSLLVRRGYARLARELTALAEPCPATVRLRLRSAGNLLALFIGDDAYPHLRTLDRALLRSSQRRIRDFLVDPAEAPAAGLRLWRDLQNLTELILGVNQREELVEHDAEAIPRLLDDMAEGADADVLPPALRALLKSLEGRDAGLDALLRRRSPAASIGEVRAALVALRGSPYHAEVPSSVFRVWEPETAVRELTALPTGEDYF
jgi:hypothetical protein